MVDWKRKRCSILNRDGNKCWICNEELGEIVPNHDLAPSIDHIIPQSKGGSNEIENLKLAHRKCNSERGNDMTRILTANESLKISFFDLINF